MRLAVLSDVHGNLTALQAVLEDLKSAGGADKTWVLGDSCAFGPRPAECLKVLRELPETQIISGNTDRYIVTGDRSPRRPKDEAEWAKIAETLRTREEPFLWMASRLSWSDYEFLAKLPRELDLHVPGYGYAIGYHGAPGSDEYILLPDTPAEEVLDQMSEREGRLGFGGHTHQPMDRDLGRWRVVNVGSVGLPFDEPRSCYALVTFEDGKANIELRRVAFDVDSVIADLRTSGNLAWEWSAGLLKKG